MKFPLKHCVPTVYLTQEIYSELICKLVTDGYTNTISNIQLISLVKMWDYIGVNRFGDILLMDNPRFYLEVDKERSDNILSEEQLWEYLK